MRILFIDQVFDAKNIGGAFKSNYSIIDELRKDKTYTIKVIARKTKYLEKIGFSVNPIRALLRSPSKKINSFIKLFKINLYLSFFPIYRTIKDFKPDVIILQRDVTFSALLAAFLKKKPVINIVRDAMELCPKNIDIYRFFENCTEILSRKNCWDCINRWRSLRILLLDKSKGTEYSLFTSFYTIYYKIQYFFIKILLWLMKYSYVNIVASPLMKSLMKKRVKTNRILVKNITPIDKTDIEISKDAIDKAILNRIENSEAIILYVIPRNEGGSKGYPFLLRLIKILPEDFLFVIVGTRLKEIKNRKNVINLEKIPTNNLYYLYRKAHITIVPSIYTEAFGRVIIESIINNTPVLTSPQCGANYLFLDKEYVKIIPLKKKLWALAIKDIIANPIKIPEEEIKRIENGFSPKECANQIITLIKKLQ